MLINFFLIFFYRDREMKRESLCFTSYTVPSDTSARRSRCLSFHDNKTTHSYNIERSKISILPTTTNFLLS
jgi:hypothetical protein